MPQTGFFCKQIEPVRWRGFCSLNRDHKKMGFIMNSGTLDALDDAGNGKIITATNDMSYYCRDGTIQKSGSMLGRRKSEWQRMNKLCTKNLSIQLWIL